MVKNPMTALSMYEQGDLDLIGDPFSSLPFDVIPKLMESKKLKSKLISRIFYLLLNTNAYPLHSKPLRRALALSIDRNILTQHLFHGEFPSLSHLPKTLSMLDEKELNYEEKSIAGLFEEALLDLQLTRETFPKIVLKYANLSGQKSLAQFIQEQWAKKLGIQVDIECSDWNTHSANLRQKKYQIGTIHLTTLYQDPMFYFDLFRDKAALCNYSGWENANFRALLDKSEKTHDKTNRRLLLQEAERLLADEMPVIPVFTQNLQYLAQDKVELVISDLGIYDFKGTRIKDLPSAASNSSRLQNVSD
jgi:oligopeptide transport system substrate-binding protein